MSELEVRAPTIEEIQAISEVMDIFLSIAVLRGLDISQVAKVCTSVPIKYIAAVESEGAITEEGLERMKQYVGNAFIAGSRFLKDGTLPTDPMGMIDGYDGEKKDERTH